LNAGKLQVCNTYSEWLLLYRKHLDGYSGIYTCTPSDVSGVDPRASLNSVTFGKECSRREAPWPSNGVAPGSRRAQDLSFHRDYSTWSSLASWLQIGAFVLFDEGRNLCLPLLHRLTRRVLFSYLAWNHQSVQAHQRYLHP
jgi:hypothetical protein